MAKHMKTASVIIIFFFLAGCAASPSSINPAYISPLKYSGHDCEQIKQEYACVNQELAAMSKKQATASTVDTVALSVGLVLFWPALFFMIGGDNEAELAQLLGDREAIEAIAIDKKCGFVSEINANKEKIIADEEKRKERMEEIEPSKSDLSGD